MALTLQRVEAKQDTNGNPRRGYVVYADNGKRLAFINVGYVGFGPEAIAQFIDGDDYLELQGSLAVTPKEWRDLNRDLIIFNRNN